MTDLRDLGPGDEVAIVRAFQPTRIVRIERVTRTQIVADGWRWQRDTGWHIGGDRWDRARIVPATDAHRTTAERSALIRRIDRVWSQRRDVVGRLSVETLRAIDAALSADEAVRDA